VFKVIQGHWIR